MLEGHTSAVLGVAFSPDGKQLASCSSDETVILWDPATGEKLHTLSGHTDRVFKVAYRPDGKHLATASADGTLRIRESATGQEVLVLEPHRKVARYAFPIWLYVSVTGVLVFALLRAYG